MISDKTGYRSFLLRLWLMKQNGVRIWRASLENPRTGEQQSFPSLEDLVDFLHDLCKDMDNKEDRA